MTSNLIIALLCLGLILVIWFIIALWRRITHEWQPSRVFINLFFYLCAVLLAPIPYGLGAFDVIPRDIGKLLFIIYIVMFAAGVFLLGYKSDKMRNNK